MRIISGKYRGAKLFSPADYRVRPTTDRIKESVFNILASKMKFTGIAVLDLFAGSGALGLEACSRGAEKVVFVDRDKDSMKLVKNNIAKLKLPEDIYETYLCEFDFALKKLNGRRFDIIFADPPYASDAYSKVAVLVEKYDILADGGVIVVEHDKDNSVNTGGFNCDCRIMGNTAVSFLTRRD